MNRARCEGKRDCEAVCPYDVFEVRTIHVADYAELGWLSRLKVLAHGKQSAYAIRAEACQACGLCVVACPEQAIELVAVSAERPVR